MFAKAWEGGYPMDTPDFQTKNWVTVAILGNLLGNILGNLLGTPRKSGTGPAPSGSLEPSRGVLPASAAQEEEQHPHQIPESGWSDTKYIVLPCFTMLYHGLAFN